MMTSDIQLSLIDTAKKYLKKNSHKNINVHSSGYCYLCAWDVNPGYAILKFWQEGFKKLFFLLKIFSKDIISISNLYNYYLINKLENNTRYTKIIVTWGLKGCFLPDGSYHDRYFKINSKDTENTIWFLIYVDDVLPEKISKNILILRKKNTFKYNLFHLFKNIFKKIFSSKFSLRVICYKISASTVFSSIVWNNFKSFINDDIKCIIMPYESQPLTINFSGEPSLKR